MVMIRTSSIWMIIKLWLCNKVYYLQMKLRRLAIVALGVAMFGFAIPASAQTNNLFSGNKSSDYQPPTGNPQSNVATGIQTNNTSLQPTNTQSSVTQQNLPTISGLQVVTIHQKGAISTASEPNKQASKFWLYFVLDCIGFAILLAALSYWSRRRKNKSAPVATETAVVTERKQVVQVKKSKKKRPSPVKRGKNQRKRS